MNMEIKTIAREITGKKVKTLRQKGIVPVHVFGHNIPSVSLQTEMSALEKLLKMAGTTKLVDLFVDGHKKGRKVLVKEVQRDYRTGKPIHVDFYEVSMEEKIKVQVPILFTGDCPALKGKKGVLMENLRSIDIECLPGRIPEKIDIDMSVLIDLGSAIHVSDLNLGEDINILTGAGEVIIKIVAERVEEVEKPPVTATAEVPVVEKAEKEGEEEEAAEKGK